MPMATVSTERTRLTRRNVLRCALVAPAVVAGARRASAAEPVSVGMVNTISDAGFFVAEAKGYFKAAGIAVKFSPFPSASGMIAPLASGDLDVGSGAVSAGHYNANERQIPVKFVADKARNAPDLSFQSIVVRSALIESGKFRSFADLKGLKFAIPAPASVGEQSILNEALKRGASAGTTASAHFSASTSRSPRSATAGSTPALPRSRSFRSWRSRGSPLDLRLWVVSIQTSRRRWSATPLNS